MAEEALQEEQQEAQQGQQAQSNQGTTWPEDVRNAWLKKTQEYSERLNSIEQQLQAVNVLANELASLRSALLESRNHQTQSSPSPGTQPTEDLDFDPWDDSSRKSFVARLREKLVSDVVNRVYNDVYDRVRASSVLSAYVGLAPYLLQRKYPGVEFDVEKLLEEAARRNTFDLDTVFKELYAEELKKREFERMRQEWEKEMQKKSQATVTSAPTPSAAPLSVPKDIPQDREGLANLLRGLIQKR